MTDPDREPEFLRATRDSYDVLAAELAHSWAGELAAKPLDRGLLGAFAELVRDAGDGLPVLDVGCGTGRVTGYLADLGLSVSGVDLSPQMIEQARQTYPDLRFAVGSMLALDLPDGALGGMIAWYSVIHIPQELLPQAFAEFHRVLAPGGYLQLAFQVGDEPLRLTEALGHHVSLDFHRRRPDQVAELLEAAGLPVRARLLREADEEGEFTERTPQAILLARKPPSPSPAPS